MKKNLRAVINPDIEPGDRSSSTDILLATSPNDNRSDVRTFFRLNIIYLSSLTCDGRGHSWRLVIYDVLCLHILNFCRRLLRFKMETLVLIPQELSLALRPGGARGREASVSVWTSTELQRGSLLYPFQGTIRIDKLHVYSYVPDHDVSRFTNCF